MNDYDAVRHFADSYGLAAMVVAFALFVFWVFRPGARRHYDDAATLIFAEEQESSDTQDKRHG